MRILLVEPDEYYHAKFSDSFSDGHQVMIAEDLATARQVLKSSLPDVIILELLLPGLPGYEILEEVGRSKTPERKPPVIIYSCVDNPEDVAAAMEKGAMAYFVKGKNMLSEVAELVNKLS